MINLIVQSKSSDVFNSKCTYVTEGDIAFSTFLFVSGMILNMVDSQIPPRNTLLL